MKLSIGITTFNRLKYTKSLVKSLEEFLGDNEYQIIIVDNCSTEKGMEEFLKSISSFSNVELILRKNRSWVNDEYHAKNIIIEKTKSDVLLFLQDDLQFLWDKKVMDEVTEEFRKAPIPCLEVNAVRKITLENRVMSHGQYFHMEGSDNKFWLTTSNHFQTMGFFKMEIFSRLGKYPVDWPDTQEYWGRSETYYADLVKRTFPQSIISVKCTVPLFAGVWNDPRGGYAFIRGDNRYGHYIDPVDESGVYYKKGIYSEYKLSQKSEVPLSFVDVANPLGWNYAKDASGDQNKYSQAIVMKEGPCEAI